MSDIGIIAMVPETWDDPPQTARHYVAAHLASHFPVIWVDPLRSWREYLRRPFLAARSSAPMRATPPGLMVMRADAFHARVYRPQCLGTLIQRHQLRRAHRCLVARGVSDVVVYCWRPEFDVALGMVEHELSCYHIDDEYSFSSAEQAPDPKEVALIRRVDQVFIHSRALMARKGAINAHTEWVPNGVDFDAFAKPQPEPADLRGIPHPRVGYVGVIKQHLDLDAMNEVASRLPDVSFVFVGPELAIGDQAPALQALRQRANCHFLGHRDLTAVPAYLQHMDAGLLCYRVNDYTKYIYPLKLHEYLAAGLPVVASRVSALDEFDDLIRRVDTVQGWTEAIQEAVTMPSAQRHDMVTRGRLVARNHDWDLLVGRIAAMVRARIEDRRAGRSTTAETVLAHGAPARTTRRT